MLVCCRALEHGCLYAFVVCCSNAQLKGSLEEQGAELVLVRGRVAAYEEQLQRMQLRLRCGSTPGAGPSTGRSLPLDSPGAELQADALEQQVRGQPPAGQGQWRPAPKCLRACCPFIVLKPPRDRRPACDI